MHKNFKDKLVADLRENAHLQTRNILFDGKCYCVLGRIHLLTGGVFEKIPNHDSYFAIEGTNPLIYSRFTLPYSTKAKAGMISCCGSFAGNQFPYPLYEKYGIPRDRSILFSLMTLNDTWKLTFPQLAEVVEEMWEKL